MRVSRAQLRARWAGEGKRINAITDDLRSGKDWTRHLLASQDGFEKPLAYLSTCPRRTLETEQAPRDLRGIKIANVDLSEAAGFSDAALDHAVLENVHLYKASFLDSSLVGAVFCGSTTLHGAILQRAKLRDAICTDISLKGADLQFADLSGCDVRGADLREARFLGAKITEEGTFGFLSLRRRWTKFGGALQTFENLSMDNNLRLRKHIARSTRIEQLKTERPIYAWFFWLFANYGRSAARFGLFAFIGCWLAFALAYTSFSVPPLLHGTPVAQWLESWRQPTFSIAGTVTPLTISDAMYLSAVTITTLGYGDIVPAQGDGLARLLVTAEAIGGVIILGAFINMLVQNAGVDGD